MRKIMILLLAAAVGIGAERPVGTAICIENLQINGVLNVSQGIYSWPLFAKDEIRTESGPAILYFGKSRIQMDRQSTVKIDVVGRETLVTLLAGRIGFVSESAGAIRIAAPGLPEVAEKSGQLWLNNGKAELKPGPPTLKGIAPSNVPRPLPSVGIYVAR